MSQKSLDSFISQTEKKMKYLSNKEEVKESIVGMSRVKQPSLNLPFCIKVNFSKCEECHATH